MLGWLLSLASLTVPHVVITHPPFTLMPREQAVMSASEQQVSNAVFSFRELEMSVDVCSHKLHKTVFDPLQPRLSRALAMLSARYEPILREIDSTVLEGNWYCPKGHRPQLKKAVLREAEVRLQLIETLATTSVR